LCALAIRGAWDERNVDRELEWQGWIVTTDAEYCPVCAEGTRWCKYCGLTEFDHKGTLPPDHEFVAEYDEAGEESDA